MQQKEINLQFLFESDEQSSEKILSFLNKKDLAHLSATSTHFQSRVKDLQRSQFNDEYKIWRAQKIQKLKLQAAKGKTTQKNAIKFIETDINYVVKMRIQDLPLKYLEVGNWEAIGQSDEQYTKSLKSDKFIKEHNNLFFKNTDCSDILFVNRSIVDPSLNFEGSAFEVEDLEENNSKYEDLFQGDALSADSYDFSNMQSLLSRQRQVVASIGKKQQKLQELQESQVGTKAYMAQLRGLRRVTIILCHGGYFSIGIFDEKGTCVFHKSDHKYVVRGKAGQRQMNCDTKCGKQVKSMGSQIRRDQEKKHQEKVHNILSECIEQIDGTDVVFLQAPGLNKLLLIRENEPLKRVSHKIRSICLTAKKANYTEVERIYNAITKVYLVLEKPSQ